jgi:outer membrane protein assembly factor BamB
VLHINNLVYAFDLADRKQLWQYNLFGKTPMTNANPVQQIPEPDGTLRLVYQDGWTQKVGQAGVVESTYVCLVTRDGLVALDPARGTTLWTKSNVSPRVHLVGDEENIYVFEQNQDGSPAATRVLRAQDGVAVEGVPDSSALFAKSNRLRIFGRNVLVFEDQNNKKAFRMVDLLTGKDVWRKGLDAGAIALRSNDSTHIGYVTPGGEIFAFDVRTGKEVFRNRIDEKWVKDHLAKVTEALLLEDGERFYVALNRPPENGISVNPVVNQGMRTVRVNGHMYCFDKASGKRLWFTDEQLENQTVILEQFHDLPVLLAATQFTKVNNGVFERNGVSVMAIEKATGRARYRKEVGPNGQFHALVTDPKAGSIELWRHDLRIRFTPDDGKTTGAADGPNPPLAQRGSPPPAVRVIAPGPVRIQILKRR